MANEIRDLPLFPLGTVLFPGMQLPLQLFEPRYLQMFQDIARQDSRFGVVLIKEGVEVGEPAVPFDIGTIARVTQHENNPDGRIILMSVGQQRFRSLEVLQQRPYMTARVEILPPDPPVPPRSAPRSRRCSSNTRAWWPAWPTSGCAMSRSPTPRPTLPIWWPATSTSTCP